MDVVVVNLFFPYSFALFLLVSRLKGVREGDFLKMVDIASGFFFFCGYSHPEDCICHLLQSSHPLSVNGRPVSSVGRVPDYRAGGLEFESQTGPTLRVLK